jgi:DNA-binding response OmpR family regulator
MRILVADDDPTYRDLLKDLLTKWHHDVVMASDGQAAWEVMQSEDAPRLVILDWMMPELDGFEVTRLLRDEKATEDVYVLLITGTRQKDEIMKVLVCGADDYLIKPFDPIDLKIHLRSAMRILHLQQELKDAKRAAQLHSIAQG